MSIKQAELIRYYTMKNRLRNTVNIYNQEFMKW